MSRVFVTSCGIFLGYDFDFEEFAPSFACHEDTFRGRVVGDAVQYVGIRGDLFVREQAAQVDDPFDNAAGGVDDDDLVGDIDVGPDLPVDPLQFVEQLYRGTPEGARPAALHPKGFRIEDAQVFAAVAHIEPLAVGREAPSFARIGESAELPTRRRVIDVGFVVFPGQLVDLAVEQRDAFAEFAAGQRSHYVRASCFEVDALQAGVSVFARTFPHHSVCEQEPLRVAVGRMGIAFDDPVGVGARRGGGSGRGFRSEGFRASRAGGQRHRQQSDPCDFCHWIPYRLYAVRLRRWPFIAGMSLL